LLVNPGILALTHHAKVTANEYPEHTDRERTKVFIPPNYLVDLVLVIDVTGSMQQEMDSVKRQLQ
jgi:predicted nucleic-acid-binding protein